MPYTNYLPSSYQDTKIAVNGVELVNRHELSTTQDRELQRFIDNNLHILQWKEREIEPPKPIRRTPLNHYEEMRKSLSRGPSPFEGSYNSLDKFATKREKKVEEYPPINANELPICPNIENHNYTDEFPGLEYLSDNTFIEEMIKQGQVTIGSNGLISQPGSRVGSSMGAPISSHFNNSASFNNHQSNTLPHQQHHTFIANNPNNCYTNRSEQTITTTTTTSYDPTYSMNSASNYGGSQSQYGSVSNNGSNYGTLKGGMKHTSTLPPTSPYSSLKRKGVSWLDQERARSLSPGIHHTYSTTRQTQSDYNRPASTIHTSSYTTAY